MKREFCGEAKRSEKIEAKLSEKIGPLFSLEHSKQSKTDPVSLHFASKRKNILCETGAPYTRWFEALPLCDISAKFLYAWAPPGCSSPPHRPGGQNDSALRPVTSSGGAMWRSAVGPRVSRWNNTIPFWAVLE
jgi:hypothetical protein